MRLVYACLIELLRELDFEISWHKVAPPTQRLIFLGILIDTISQTLELPQDKLVALQVLVQACLHRRRASKKHLLVSSAGPVKSCMVVEPSYVVSLMSWALCSPLLPDIASSLGSMLIFPDLSWWSEFVMVFNGKQLFLDFLSAVAISRLHDPYYVCLAFLYFCHYMPAVFVYTQIMLVLHFCFLGTLAANLQEERMLEVFNFHSYTFADNTKSTYRTHRDT